MFPIRDEIPSRRAPVVTWAIIVACVLVYGYQAFLPEEGQRRLLYLFGVVPARLSDPAWAARVGFPPGGAVSFLTSMFLHGGLFHLVTNMWSLWIFGDNVEDRMGRVRYGFFYLGCGLLAGLAHWIFNPLSTSPTIGASGAIAGVLGAYMRWYPRARVLTLIPIFIYPLFVNLPAIVFLGIWFVLQLFSGALSLGSSQAGGVAWWAHIGGFVAGFLLAGPLSRRPTKGVPERVRHFVLPSASARSRNPPQPPHP